MNKALKLWEEWFKFSDNDPWFDVEGTVYCFFCVNSYPDHEDDCIYERAERLVIKPKQFIVLGMHRSGTSLVAHLLKEMGVFMGYEFLEPDEGNPLGYWEDVDFLALNKQILVALDGTWRTLFSRHDILVAKAEFEKRIQAIVDIRDHNHMIWGWKDPRTSLLVWLYHEHLSNPHYIVVQRGYHDVISSLERIHGQDEKWRVLRANYWQHVRDFLSSTPNVKFHKVRYEHLCDPGKTKLTLRELANFIGQPEMEIDVIRC